jgi:hypothetical protein
METFWFSSAERAGTWFGLFCVAFLIALLFSVGYPHFLFVKSHESYEEAL